MGTGGAEEAKKVSRLMERLFKELGKFAITVPFIAALFNVGLTVLFIPDKDGDGDIIWSEFVDFQSRSRKALNRFWPMDLQSLRREFRLVWAGKFEKERPSKIL